MIKMKKKKNNINKIYLEKRTSQLIIYFNKFNKRKILNAELKKLKTNLTLLDKWYLENIK